MLGNGLFLAPVSETNRVREITSNPMKSLKLLFASAFAVAISLSSCSSSSDDGGNGGPGPSDQEGQKEYVEQTATELMNEIKASDFQPVVDLVEYVKNNLTRASSSKTDAIDQWFKACIEACTVSGEGTTYVKRLFQASKFAAEFTFQNGVWVKTGNGNGNSLTFKFNDQNGNPCVATATATGSQPVHASFFDDVDHDYYPSYRETYYENTVEIPTQVTASLTQGSTKLAEATVNMTVSTDEFYPARSNASVTVNANVCGYNVNLSRAIYNGGKNAGLTVAVSKNGKNLVSAQADADIVLTNEGKFVSGGAASLNVDVLGKVQVKGNTNNISNVVNATAKIEQARDEQELKDRVNELNSLYDAGVYYNESNTRQASFKMYPIKYVEEYRDYKGNTQTYEEMRLEPVIEFADGTSCTFGEFFNDEKFKALIKRFESWVKDFENLVK